MRTTGVGDDVYVPIVVLFHRIPADAEVVKGSHLDRADI